MPFSIFRERHCNAYSISKIEEKEKYRRTQSFRRTEKIMEQFTPKLFSVLKSYTKEQFVKDVIDGIIVAIIELTLTIA